MNAIDEQDKTAPWSLPTEAHPVAGPSTSEPDEFQAALGTLRAEFGSTWNAVRRAAYVERQSLGLTMYDAASKLIGWACALAALFVLTISAVLLFLHGARRGLQEWTDDAWWCDPALAILVAGGVVLAFHGLRRHVHRSTLSRVKRALASDDRLGTANPSGERTT